VSPYIVHRRCLSPYDHRHQKGSDPAGREMFLKQAEPLVKWLEEESEEEEEGEESD